MTGLLASYGKIYNVGHRAVVDILSGGEVVIQEKVDGSQFTFGVTDVGSPIVRSKGRVFPIDASDDLFKPACATVRRLAEAGSLTPGWTYRGETLKKPKHNTLSYLRVPDGNIVLFDIDTGEESYLPPDHVRHLAVALDLEVVPTLYQGPGDTLTRDNFDAWMKLDSFLGKTTIEGFVIKAYGRFEEWTGKTLMAKHVSEAFKETNSKSFRERNPTRSDVVAQLIDELHSPVRWQKAVQHLRDNGELEGSPVDIGKLIVEAKRDILREEEDHIKDRLFENVSKKIAAGAVKGLPGWYKEQLLAQQIGDTDGTD